MLVELSELVTKHPTPYKTHNHHTTTSLYIVVNSIGGYGFCPNSLPLLQKKNCIYNYKYIPSYSPDFLKMTMIKQTRYL